MLYPKEDHKTFLDRLRQPDSRPLFHDLQSAKKSLRKF